MPHRYIFVLDVDGHDPSRWLHITGKENGDCVLQLQDMCLPGKVSQLEAVSCPLSFLRTALDRGPLQITNGSGYVLLRRAGDTVSIEFRDVHDTVVTKGALLAEELRARLDVLAAEIGAAPS